MVTLNPTPVCPSQPDNANNQNPDTISSSSNSQNRTDNSESSFDTTSTLGKALKLIHQLHSVPDCDDAYWSSAMVPQPAVAESSSDITEETGNKNKNCASGYLHRGTPIAHLVQRIGKWVQKLYSFRYDRIDAKP